MRRDRWQPSAGLFRGAELVRLMTMIVMLGVLFLLISRARDPKTWTFLADDDAAVTAAGGPPAQGAPASDGSTKAPGGLPAPEKAAAPEVATGPTDLDPDEADAIREEFQAVSDATLYNQPEEMEAYDRVVRWVQRQPISLLRQRAIKDPAFNDLAQSPDAYRGKLVELDLNIRRVLKYEEKNRDGVQLYEVWGWTKESKSWPYVVVVLDKPQAMPVGAEVYENAVFAGYFFKLQAYQPAAAKPNAKPLFAPMLIGRLSWRPATLPQVQKTDWYWGALLALVLLVFLILRVGLLFLGRRRKVASAASLSSAAGTVSIDDWLDQADDGPAEGNNLESGHELTLDGQAGNGHVGGSAQHFGDGLDGGRAEDG